ncbi:hypothetical protein [Mucilaginibacter lacusdianchii]|uniref:hypothetical protein n=1 Tax=Mucilaginibacter lacusdianchii TaxID=2684211 RepID=UPI00131C6BF5|nr:hypothetical protein [Mucilaginibacter sp. JXJ CY 39]
METQQIINQILFANQAEDVFSISSFKKEYARLIKLLHPDVCHLPRAGEAVAMMNQFRDEMYKYWHGEDDAGKFVRNEEDEVTFQGDPDLLYRSYENYQRLMSINDDTANHFKKYLPKSMNFSGRELIVNSEHPMLPLTHLIFPHQHTNWILSRIFEFITWLHQIGYCHLGINPESIFIVPQTHGIICTSFYHLTRLNTKPESLSGRYLNWYPAIVFDQKKAIQYVDMSLAQRTALYMLGDKSGNGVVLKKNINPQLIDFLITPHYDSYQTYQEFRQLLLQLFGKPQFHPLNI